MNDYSKYEKGFYKVDYEDTGWTVMYFNGKEWYDFVSGDYATVDHDLYIKEVGDKIDLPTND